MMKGRYERMLIKGVAWVGLAALAAFTVFMVSAVWDVRGKERAAWQERENARHALLELQDRQARLTKSVSSLETERGIEEELRKRFPVAKEGEEVIVLVDAPKREDEEVVAKPPEGFWGTVREWLHF